MALPLQLVWFERLMYAALAAFLTGLLLYSQRSEEPAPAGVAIFLVLIVGLVVALLVTLVWLVARRRQGWGRYLVCALLAVTTPHFLRQALVAFRSYPFEAMLAWAQFVMLGGACMLVFTREARQWFKSGRLNPGSFNSQP